MDILPRDFERVECDNASPLSESERNELDRLRENMPVFYRVMSDAAGVLQHAEDAVNNEMTKARCYRQRDRIENAIALIDRRHRS